MLTPIPLLIIPLAVYNIIIFLTPRRLLVGAHCRHRHDVRQPLVRDGG